MSKKYQCGKSDKCSSCCTGSARTCFGKRSDAFYCYNDDKAKMWPSNWHPMNPNLLCVGGTRSCQENLKNDTLTAGKSSSSKQQFSTLQHSSYQNQNGRCQFCMQPPPPPRKKLRRELLDIRDYLRNCMYHRLNINWTDEDDAILIKCIYNNLIKVRPPNKVCSVLNEIMQNSKNVLFTEFVTRVKDEFRKNGHCDDVAMQSLSTTSQQPQTTYQYDHQLSVPQIQLPADIPKVARTKCYICEKRDCLCDKNKNNLRTKNERVMEPRPSVNRRQRETSIALAQSKIRNNSSSDDDSDCERIKSNAHRVTCQCRIK